MAVEKFTQTPTEIELVSKVDEIIDALANAGQESITDEEIDAIIDGTEI